MRVRIPLRAAAITLAAAALLLSSAAPAAARQAQAVQLGPVDASAHPQVSVVLTAPPQLRGEPLSADAVRVVENGAPRPATLTQLSNERLEVVLVIDTSGSMKGAPFESAVAAARTFIERLPADARVSLVSFGTTPQLASALTDDRPGSIAALGAMEPRGETALYDAVVLATQQFSGEAGSRRSIVVLSDGGDTASRAPLEAAVDRVAASGARLDVVGLLTAETAQQALDGLAGAGHGRVVPADDPAALTAIYDELAASLANEYTLTWQSTSHGSTEVTIQVQQGAVAAESRLVVEYPAAPAAPASTSPAEVAPAPAAPPADQAADAATATSGAAQTWLLVTGASCVAVALLVLGLVAFAPRARAFRRRRLGTISVPKDVSALSNLVNRATASADAALERHGRRGALSDRLEQAGLALRPGEFVVIVLSAMTAALAVGTLLAGPLLGLVLAALIAWVCWAVTGHLRNRRRRMFSEQLPETLQLMSGTLRAGYGLLQAVDTLAREAPEPTASEFRRLVVEARLGRDLSTSLDAMVRRIESDDFEWVVQAIGIHREVGGDLAEVLDTVGATIRERNQVARQVRTLTAEGRLSAYVLIALPLLLALALRVINPEYFELLTYGPGLVMSGVGVLMLGAGALWFRKLCRLDF